MADTRINALSTATSSASDDYVPIDGTTNGTRKLSAYSPSFGGNATVGGTLTVNSTTTSVSGYYFGASADASLTRVAAGVIALGGAATSRIDINGATDVGIGFRQTGVRDWFVAAKSAELQTSCLSAGSIASYESGVLVRVRDTTASTSTSSGALVVGNGTSGGLGVGGAIYAGGVISTTSSSGVAVVGGRQWSIRANASGGSPASAFVIRDDSLGSERVTIDASGNIAALSTTASTSTSSGALVVSGGVGVAKSINAGALNESHTFTGGDTGSGTSIITCKGGLGATVFQVQGEGTTIVAGKLTANAASNAFGISTAQTPASASATGTTGTICWDTSYIYVCTATNTWKRVAISTW